MNAKRLHRRWQDSLEARVDSIRKLLRQRSPLSATEVHDLRVALRRARLLADLGAHALGRTKTKHFRDATRVLLDLLDAVRDCDVALDWLRDAHASAALIKKLQIRRDRFWRATKRRLQLPATKLSIDPKTKGGAKKLDRRLAKLSKATAERCHKTIKLGNEVPTSELHELRRVVRRWRYLRELQLTAHGIRRDPRLRLLIRVQECLGALQNAEVILDQLKTMGRTEELRRLHLGLRANHSHHRRESLHQIKSLPASA